MDSLEFIEYGDLTAPDYDLIDRIVNGAECSGVQLPWSVAPPPQETETASFTFGSCDTPYINTTNYQTTDDEFFFTTVKDYKQKPLNSDSPQLYKTAAVNDDLGNQSPSTTCLTQHPQPTHHETGHTPTAGLTPTAGHTPTAVVDHIQETFTQITIHGDSSADEQGSAQDAVVPDVDFNVANSHSVQYSDAVCNGVESAEMRAEIDVLSTSKELSNSWIDQEVKEKSVGIKPVSAWGNKSGSGSKLFADILKSPNSSSDAMQSAGTNAEPLPVIEHNNSTGTPKIDKHAVQIASLLSIPKIKYQAKPIIPRGLINKGNWCYINATLQALSFCSPFYNLLRSLAPYAVTAEKRGSSSTPITDCLVQFMNEFDLMDPTMTSHRDGGRFLIAGESFEPLYIYRILHVMDSDGGSSFKYGHQEDAEEFFSSLLNAVHDEMVDITNEVNDRIQAKQLLPNGHHSANPNKEHSEDDGAWEQVGPKNKSVTTRTASIASSPISSLFGGQIRYNLSRTGQKESATLQPFFTLQLEVQSPLIMSVNDALLQFIAPERIPDYTCSTTKTEIEASRRQTLEVLPPILTLHLKCFVYDKSGGCQKIVKRIGFGTELCINKELLSPNVRNKYTIAQKRYLLFAVVHHHGARMLGGHYTTHFLHSGTNQWMRADDQHISYSTLSQLTQFTSTRMPYLLFYKRADLVQSPH